MVALFNRSGQAQDDRDAGSLRERFRAWWDGDEILELSPEPVPAREPEPKHQVHYEVPRQHWETTRVGLVQKVWGQGFASPGGREHILNMVKTFGLDPAMTVLDLGTGLGGAARVMCEKFGVWVTGFEADEALAEAGMALSVKAGMGEHVPVKVFDPEKFQYKPNSVDCVFSKEFLFTIEKKQEFLATIELLLKKKGQFLFTDYVLAKPHGRSETVTKWLDQEPIKAHPWAIATFEEALASAHLEIRVKEDVTKVFRSMVIQGWSDYIGATPRGSVGEDSAPMLLDEIELWTRRVQAIDSGDLKVCRVHTFKKETEGMLSDW